MQIIRRKRQYTTEAAAGCWQSQSQSDNMASMPSAAVHDCSLRHQRQVPCQEAGQPQPRRPSRVRPPDNSIEYALPSPSLVSVRNVASMSVRPSRVTPEGGDVSRHTLPVDDGKPGGDGRVCSLAWAYNERCIASCFRQNSYTREHGFAFVAPRAPFAEHRHICAGQWPGSHTSDGAPARPAWTVLVEAPAADPLSLTLLFFASSPSSVPVH